MLKAIKDIFTYKGEILRLPFLINYVILRLTFIIVNLISVYVLTSINPNIYSKIIVIILGLLLILLELSIIFNYKRRILSICKNLPVSITLSILLTIPIMILEYFIYPMVMILLNLLIIPAILAIIPAKNNIDFTV